MIPVLPPYQPVEGTCQRNPPSPCQNQLTGRRDHILGGPESHVHHNTLRALGVQCNKLKCRRSAVGARPASPSLRGKATLLCTKVMTRSLLMGPCPARSTCAQRCRGVCWAAKYGRPAREACTADPDSSTGVATVETLNHRNARLVGGNAAASIIWSDSRLLKGDQPVLRWGGGDGGRDHWRGACHVGDFSRENVCIFSVNAVTSIFYWCRRMRSGTKRRHRDPEGLFQRRAGSFGASPIRRRDGHLERAGRPSDEPTHVSSHEDPHTCGVGRCGMSCSRRSTRNGGQDANGGGQAQ